MLADSKDDEPSRRDVEKQIEELKQAKTRTEDDLKRMELTEKRIFLEQQRRNASKDERERPASSGRPREETKDKDVKDDKSDKADNDDTKKEERHVNRDGEPKEKHTHEKATKDEGHDAESGKPKEDEKGKEEVCEKRKRDNDGRPNKSDPRNRNIFGKLLGHLNQAKTRLETEKGWKTTDLKHKATERLQEKLLLTKMSIVDLKKEQFDKQRQDSEEKMNQIDKAIEGKELLLLQKRLEGHYSLMMNFIRTRAEPSIFYLPAKHSKKTEAMLEETRSAIKRKISSLKYELQPVIAGKDEPEDAVRASVAAAAAAAGAAGEDMSTDVADKEETANERASPAKSANSVKSGKSDDAKDKIEGDEPEKKKQKTGYREASDAEDKGEESKADADGDDRDGKKRSSEKDLSDEVDGGDN